MGHDSNSVSEIFENTLLDPTTISDFGGKSITHYLGDCLNDLGYGFKDSSEIEQLPEIKHQKCIVSKNYEEEIKKKHETNFETPDGKIIDIQNSSFEAPEVLFNPKLIGSSSEPLHHMIYNSIVKQPKNLHDDLFGNIVLEGGGSMFQGLSDRLDFELKNLLAKGSKLKVIAPPERKYSQWIGASILSSLSSFEKNWITPADYEEFGRSVIHKRCPQNETTVFSKISDVDLKD